ncbi:hypothetical protein AB0758_00660 [Tolypothrix bouteillei VB521301_2]
MVPTVIIVAEMLKLWEDLILHHDQSYPITQIPSVPAPTVAAPAP